MHKVIVTEAASSAEEHQDWKHVICPQELTHSVMLLARMPWKGTTSMKQNFDAFSNLQGIKSPQE